MRALVPTLILLAACSSSEPTTAASAAEPRAVHAPTAAKPTPRPTASRPAPPTGAVSAVTPEGAPSVDCQRYHRGLAGAVGRTMRAAGGREFYLTAVDKLEAAPRPCRDGRWYVAAARLLRYQDTPVAGLSSPSDALREGLKQPSSRELLTVVAFLAPLGAGPGLPPDACAQVTRAPVVAGPAYESEDRAAYVCAHAALNAKNWQRAGEHFASITLQRRYPDLALRRAQAGYCAGKRAHKHERRARRLAPTAATAFGASHREHKLLRQQAKASQLRQLRCR